MTQQVGGGRCEPSHGHPCILAMVRTRRNTLPSDHVERIEQPERSVYEQRMPLWEKYYQRVRRSIRFPRYYRKDLNW